MDRLEIDGEIKQNLKLCAVDPTGTTGLAFFQDNFQTRYSHQSVQRVSPLHACFQESQWYHGALSLEMLDDEETDG